MTGAWEHSADKTAATCDECGFTHTVPGISFACPVCADSPEPVVSALLAYLLWGLAPILIVMLVAAVMSR